MEEYRLYGLATCYLDWEAQHSTIEKCLMSIDFLDIERRFPAAPFEIEASK